MIEGTFKGVKSINFNPNDIKRIMSKIIMGLIILAGIGFVMAVIGALFNFSIIRVSPEAFSRACNNLALIAIALAVCFKEEAKG